jgi:hypothetical protein
MTIMKRLWYGVGIILVVGVIAATAILLAPKSPIPPSLRNQVTSTLLVPEGGGYSLNRDSAKYDKDKKVLTYTASYAGTKLVVSEQPTPSEFVDVPEVYDKVTAGMNNYQTFDSGIGTVHLTQPKQLSGKQAAVLNTKGTLMFVKPENALTDDQWRLWFNHIQVAN